MVVYFFAEPFGLVPLNTVVNTVDRNGLHFPEMSVSNR